VHPPSGGTWNSTGRTPFVLASDWLGPPPGMPADGLSGPQRLVRRYLAAYGPATVSDIRAWSGVSGLREVVDSQRGELRVLADEAGRDLVDLPDGSRPEPDIPAPIRFLPEFDNLLLAYADRTRMMSDPVRRQVCVGDVVAATVLVDGVVGATWSLTRDSGTAVLTIRPFHPWSRTDGAAVIEEGTRLLAFAAADASESMVRIDPEDGGTGG
jgi:hypothetical protein